MGKKPSKSSCVRKALLELGEKGLVKSPKPLDSFAQYEACHNIGYCSAEGISLLFFSIDFNST